MDQNSMLDWSARGPPWSLGYRIHFRIQIRARETVRSDGPSVAGRARAGSLLSSLLRVTVTDTNFVITLWASSGEVTLLESIQLDGYKISMGNGSYLMNKFNQGF